MQVLWIYGQSVNAVLLRDHFYRFHTNAATMMQPVIDDSDAMPLPPPPKRSQGRDGTEASDDEDSDLGIPDEEMIR